MIYRFLATYPEFENIEYTMRFAQNLVLEEWRSALDHKKVPFIADAKISFKTYDISKYPYQELLKNWVYKNYRNSWGDLCSFGEFYDDVESLIAALDTQKKLIELTIEETD
jgi:hypothetical protein